MNISSKTSRFALLTLLLVGCSATEVQESKAFPNDQAAAVHFMKSKFSIMDCSDMGIISKGEVDEHFYDLFYAINKSRSLSISRDELQGSLYDSNDAQVSYIFELMDSNLDRVVSTKEFRSFMFTAIDLLDTNKNGEVTLADVGLEAPKIIRAHER